ncbi:hypothetical protein C8R43DRAFT_311052 [Mycena crocata]|nr:hypothetical protein C8R43DRAFT_311052 [Mycena crocata]
MRSARHHLHLPPFREDHDAKTKRCGRSGTPVSLAHRRTWLFRPSKTPARGVDALSTREASGLAALAWRLVSMCDYCDSLSSSAPPACLLPLLSFRAVRYHSRRHPTPTGTSYPVGTSTPSRHLCAHRTQADKATTPTRLPLPTPSSTLPSLTSSWVVSPKFRLEARKAPTHLQPSLSGRSLLLPRCSTLAGFCLVLSLTYKPTRHSRTLPFFVSVCNPFPPRRSTPAGLRLILVLELKSTRHSRRQGIRASYRLSAACKPAPRRLSTAGLSLSDLCQQDPTPTRTTHLRPQGTF